MPYFSTKHCPEESLPVLDDYLTEELGMKVGYNTEKATCWQGRPLGEDFEGTFEVQYEKDHRVLTMQSEKNQFPDTNPVLKEAILRILEITGQEKIYDLWGREEINLENASAIAKEKLEARMRK